MNKVGLAPTYAERAHWRNMTGEDGKWSSTLSASGPTKDRKLYGQESKTFSWQHTHYQRGLK